MVQTTLQAVDDIVRAREVRAGTPGNERGSNLSLRNRSSSDGGSEDGSDGEENL
ncbi:hypothetical protein HDU97_009352, partial [Phlyctochytrium planicorne]